MKLRLAVSILALSGLASCGEPGRARVSDQELVGNYTLEFQRVTLTVTGQPKVSIEGKEQLTLNADKTYIQVFSSPTHQFTNHGTWKTSNLFLGTTEIELVGANVQDRPSQPPTRVGQRYLQVHRENGKMRLAINEAAEAYYERVQ